MVLDNLLNGDGRQRGAAQHYCIICRHGAEQTPEALCGPRVVEARARAVDWFPRTSWEGIMFGARVLHVQPAHGAAAEVRYCVRRVAQAAAGKAMARRAQADAGAEQVRRLPDGTDLVHGRRTTSVEVLAACWAGTPPPLPTGDDVARRMPARRALAASLPSKLWRTRVLYSDGTTHLSRGSCAAARRPPERGRGRRRPSWQVCRRAPPRRTDFTRAPRLPGWRVTPP